MKFENLIPSLLTFIVVILLLGLLGIGVGIIILGIEVVPLGEGTLYTTAFLIKGYIFVGIITLGLINGIRSLVNFFKWCMKLDLTKGVSGWGKNEKNN